MKYKEQLIEFTRDIIKIPSMNGQEKEVLERVRDEMVKLGYQKIWFDNQGNLFGKIGNGETIIAIDGHLDTVAPGNKANWSYDPFGAEVKDGRIYGRGSCDQKGGLAAAVYSGKVLLDRGVPDNVSLIVCATVLEEDFEGVSWKYILEQEGFKPDLVVLTEPTNLEIKIGQRGRTELEVHVKGTSSHGSAPERGENAVYKATDIVKEIEALNLSYTSSSLLGKASIAVTDIKSEAPSLCAVPDKCIIHLDRRLTEGETLESCVNEVLNLPSVERHRADISVPEYKVKSYTGHVIDLPAYYPAWLMDKHDPFVLKAVEAFRKEYSKEPVIDVWAFSTNGVSTKGMHNIPTVGFGPGNEEVAHSPDEYIEISQLVNSVPFYASLAETLKQ